jgi:inorganic triphosphatase YgiF
VSDHAQREVELKLELPETALRRVSRHRSLERHGEGPVTTRRLRSVYFDSVDRALLRAGLSLRIREIGDGDPPLRVQTLKAGERSSGGLFQRQEDEVEVRGGLPEPQAVADPTLRSTLQRVIAGRTLREVFETDVQRSQRRMRLGRDVWSADLDVGELRAGGLREPICELELELVRGSPVILYDTALALLADVPLWPGLVSKAQRGYALAEGRHVQPPLVEALAQLREVLEDAPEERRAVLAAELALLEQECAGARRREDLERLQRSARFARTALELGRSAARVGGP